MAKPKTSYIIEESESDPNLLMVWLPKPASAGRINEAIEGVHNVWHNKVRGCLNVWLNPCYDKHEIIAEIKAMMSKFGLTGGSVIPIPESEAEPEAGV